MYGGCSKGVREGGMTPFEQFLGKPSARFLELGNGVGSVILPQ